MHFLAVLVELVSTVATGIFYTMKVDLNPFFMQHSDLVEYIYHTTIIWGVGYIKGDDM